MDIVSPGLQTDTDKQKAQQAQGGAVPITPGAPSAGGGVSTPSSTAPARPAPQGSGVGPNISRILAANNPGRTAGAITGRVGAQANQVREGIESAKNTFNTAAGQQQQAANTAYGTATQDLQTGKASDEGLKIANATYTGPTQLSLGGGVINTLGAVQGAAQAAQTSAGRQNLVASQFGSQGQPYSKGAGALDALLLGIGGAKQLRQVGRQAADLSQDVGQSQKVAETQALATTQDIEQKKANIQKLLQDKLSGFETGTKAAQQQLIDKINAGTASLDEMKQAGIDLSGGANVELTPELLASISAKSFGNADQFKAYQKYGEAYKQGDAINNVLQRLGALKTEELGTPGQAALAATQKAKDDYQKLVAEKTGLTDTEFADTRAKLAANQALFGGIGSIQKNPNEVNGSYLNTVAPTLFGAGASNFGIPGSNAIQAAKSLSAPEQNLKALSDAMGDPTVFAPAARARDQQATIASQLEVLSRDPRAYRQQARDALTAEREATLKANNYTLTPEQQAAFSAREQSIESGKAQADEYNAKVTEFNIAQKNSEEAAQKAYDYAKARLDQQQKETQANYYKSLQDKFAGKKFLNAGAFTQQFEAPKTAAEAAAQQAAAQTKEAATTANLLQNTGKLTTAALAPKKSLTDLNRGMELPEQTTTVPKKSLTDFFGRG